MYNRTRVLEALKNWANLKTILMEEDEDFAVRCLRAELNGKHRKEFVRRIHGRINRLRAIRERKEMRARK